MSEAQNGGTTVRLTLSSEQASQVKLAIGRDADAIELTVQELEQRIVPNLIAAPTTVASPDALAVNANETLLVA